MGVVEAPGHEAPLCPVPPRTGGVTTIAPVERGRSSSSSQAKEAEVDPLKPQGKKELRAVMSPNPKVVGPPHQVPGQLLPPEPLSSETKLPALLPKTAKATGKIILPKKQGFGATERPSLWPATGGGRTRPRRAFRPCSHLHVPTQLYHLQQKPAVGLRAEGKD